MVSFYFETPDPGAFVPHASGQSVALQADGSIVVAGFTAGPGGASRLLLLRFGTSGYPDTSFHDGGYFPVGIDSNAQYGYGLAIQPDGKAVAVGTSNQGGLAAYAMQVVRTNIDGSLDTSFHGNGELTVPRTASFSEVGFSVAIQPDGKILAAGRSFWDNHFYEFDVVRLNADGTLDTAFNGTGKLALPVGPGVPGTEFFQYDFGQAIALAHDGRIVVAGYTEGAFGIVRLNADGSLDNGFNGNGKLVLPVGDAGPARAHDVVVQADGRILVAGETAGGFALVRLNADGSLDDSFHGGGTLVLPVGAGAGVAHSVVVQHDGRILVAGSAGGSGNTDMCVVRLDANGALDPSFNGTGVVLVPSPDSDDVANDMVVLPDGKIVLAGQSTRSDGVAAIVVRLDADGSIDDTFASHASPLRASGNEFDNLVVGGAGRDTLDGAAGNDTLEGGSGIDTAIYHAARSHYTIARDGDGGWLVASTDTGEGTDKVDVERLHFSDMNVALDVDGPAGSVVRVLGAVFGRDVAATGMYVGAGLSARDSGVSGLALVQLALDVRFGPHPSDSDVVRIVYGNLVHHAPDDATLQSLTALLGPGVLTQAELVLLAADSTYNADNVGLTGLAQTGIGYV